MSEQETSKLILLCMDDNQESIYADELKNYGIDTLRFSGYGKKIISSMKEKSACAIIMDCFAKDVDALGVLSEITNLSADERPFMIVVLPMHNRKLMNILLEHGTDYVFIGVPTVDRLISTLAAVLDINSSSTMRERRLNELLESLGIPKKTKGFNLIADAVLTIIENKENLHGITKCLYPDIAKKHGTTAFTAEKEIRGCIAKAWQNTERDMSIANRCFGINDDSLNLKPSNKIFLESVARFFETEYLEA